VSAFCEPLEPVPTWSTRPGRARGGPATPAGVRVVVPLLSGGSLRSPPANFLSPRWGGIRCRLWNHLLSARAEI